MRTRAALAMVMIMVMPGATAEADDPAQAALVLFDAGKYSEALRAGKQAVGATPSSAGAHHAYGFVLRRAFRRREALKELERAHQLSPEDAVIAVELAWVLAETGDLERARSVTAHAAQSAPGEAREVQEWLDREQRIKNGPDEVFPPGSASGFVAQVMRKLVRHRVEDVFRDDFDRAFLERWAAESTIPSSSTDEFITRLAGELEEVMEKRSAGASLHGYEVASEPTERDGRTYVDVGLLMDSRFNSTQLETFKKWAADPSLPVPMNEDLATVLRGLDPADRLTTIAALGEQTTTGDLAIQFELTGKSGAWKITDVVQPGSGTRLSSMMGVVRTLVKRGAVEAPSPRNRAYEKGKAVGQLLGSLLVVALFIALWRRNRRRKG